MVPLNYRTSICMTASPLAVPSNLSVPKVLEPDRAATSAHAKEGPKPGTT